MKKFALTLSLLVLVAASGTALAADLVFVQNLPCGGVIVTEVDPNAGCIVRQWGTDCDGKSWMVTYSIHVLAADPGGPYDLFYNGFTSTGNPWYVKSTYDHTSGRVISTWGQNGVGEYYKGY